MPLAPYACFVERSRGRLIGEPQHALRTAYQRDRDRIVHSTAFRRLEYKTQVFVNHVGDHFRTRLTHSLEVAQVTRTVARLLGVDEDLAEAIALAHDLGHSPFGHAGEDALDACLKDHGGFNHNVQTLRVITRLEQRHASFDGLNPTFETVEGLVQHNGPLAPPVHPFFAELAEAFAMELGGRAPIEAQVAAIADDIAYVNHDLDDGLRAGILALDDFRELPVVGRAACEVAGAWPDLETHRQVHETVRRVMDRMVSDLVVTSRALIEDAAPQDVDDVRGAGPLVAFSAEMQGALGAIKAFLHARVYRHYKVNRMTAKARRVVGELFEVLASDPDCLPSRWRQRCDQPSGPATAAAVRDYIAGMTDRFALDEHARLTRLDDVRT